MGSAQPQHLPTFKHEPPRKSFGLKAENGPKVRLEFFETDFPSVLSSLLSFLSIHPV
jgi:hypothetical protein